MSSEAAGNCAVCNEAAVLFCGGCKTVRYCNAEHQKQHWKAHKPECLPFEVKTGPNARKILVAKRDIEAGAPILTEAPLIVGPAFAFNEHNMDRPIVPCVGCFKLVTVGAAACPKCNWPCCSPNCKGLQNQQLHGIECQFLQFGAPIPNEITDFRMYLNHYRADALIAIKCLVQQRKNVKKWNLLMEMESNEKKRKGTPYYLEAEDRIVSYLGVNYLSVIKAIEERSNQKVLPICDAETLHKICGIIESNGLNIGCPSGQELSGLYPTAYLLEHSCLPNCFYTFDFSNNFRINVKAGRPIKKGEHLTTMYTHVLWGTQMRREHLKDTKYFECKCDRCKDPTELGTYLSALKCMGTEEQGACGGYQLPVDPLSASTEWSCNKCPVRISNDHVNFLMSQMNEEVDGLLVGRKASIKELEDLIEKLSKFLHANHYHLFALKHCLIQLYGSQAGCVASKMSDALLQRKIDMCEGMLKVAETLDPHHLRLALYIGIILNELATAQCQLGSRLVLKEDQALYGEEVCKKFGENLLKAKKVFASDLETTQSKQLYEEVVKKIEKFNLN